MLSLQDLRKKRQDLMDKEKKRQEEKVKKKKFNPAYASNRDINIFLLEFCVCQYVHVLVFFFKFFFLDCCRETP